MSGNRLTADEVGTIGMNLDWAGKETWDQLHNLWHDGRELRLCIAGGWNSAGTVEACATLCG